MEPRAGHYILSFITLSFKALLSLSPTCATSGRSWHRGPVVDATFVTSVVMPLFIGAYVVIDLL